MSTSTVDNSIYKFLVKKLEEFLEITKNFDKTPLFKIFEFIIKIYKEDENKPEGFCIIIIFILKLLFAIVFLILPIVLTFYSIIILLNISTKSVKYSWLEDKYNYQNNKYDYIRKLFKITKYLVFSERIFVYLISSILFMVLLVAFYLFNYCTGNKEGKDKNTPSTQSKPYFNYLISRSGSISETDFMKLLKLNISLFSLLLFILIFYYSIYFNDYKDVYESNKRINEIYYEYLDKDYIREICNNFRDDKNNINSKCYLDKLPTDGYLLVYINNKTLLFDSTGGENVDFDNLNLNDNTTNAFIILKSLITHQFLINKYNNRFIQKYEYDSCKSIDIDLIMSKENKLNNLFVCFKETTNHPFNIKIIDVLDNVSALTSNHQAKGKIYEKYLSINNELSRHISTISKSKLNETILQIIISIVFIIYLVIFFYLFWTK